jgi:hypothetical protein
MVRLVLVQELITGEISMGILFEKQQSLLLLTIPVHTPYLVRQKMG